jgi:uncharacterized phage protein (TIGR02218 family)
MPDWFKDDLTSLAFCWRLERRDGVVLGFTSHDRDLVLDGLAYRAAPGMVPSAIERRESLDPGTMDLSGALTSSLITEADLIAGRWDAARLRVTAVNWANPEDGPLFLVRGELGSVESDGRYFSAELRGPSALLEAPVVEETSPECRAELGDRRCRVDMSARRMVSRIVAADGASLTVDNAPGDCGFGTLCWLDGPNAGLRGAVMASSGVQLTLREPPPFPPEAGTIVELTEGCDKRLATCATRFANAENFRGEPHLPGNDLLVRYAK